MKIFDKNIFMTIILCALYTPPTTPMKPVQPRRALPSIPQPYSAKSGVYPEPVEGKDKPTENFKDRALPPVPQSYSEDFKNRDLPPVPQPLIERARQPYSTTDFKDKELPPVPQPSFAKATADNMPQPQPFTERQRTPYSTPPSQKPSPYATTTTTTTKNNSNISPIKKYPATHNLIMLLDPKKDESPESHSRTMTDSALIGLYEQVAPIIMTSNILELIITMKQRVGENNFQLLRTRPAEQIMPFAQQLVKAYNLHEQYLNVIQASLINFDNKTYNCYFHKSSNLVLIIPQQYINKNIPNAAYLSQNDQVMACGFNPSVLTKIDNLSPDYLLQQLPIQQSKLNKEQFVNQLTSLFVPQKKDGNLIHPEQDTKWAIYISGHGGPAYQSIGNTHQIMPQIAHVIGLNMRNFTQLMKFFDKILDVAYLHYTTCFSGGYNQVFVNHVLSALNVDFIVSSEGIGEKSVKGVPFYIKFVSQDPRIRPDHPFTEFFERLQLFIANPKQFVKNKKTKKDPIVEILLSIHPERYIEPNNQPFVRFPGVGVFGALSLNAKTKVLTETIAKSHEIEKKPINLSNFNMIILHPYRINVPLNLGKLNTNDRRAIVSPTATTRDKYQEKIHVFKEINCQSTLQTLLFNFVHLNTSMNSQTFIIKELKGIQYSASGLPLSNQPIYDIIIQINNQKIHSGMGEMTATVNIAFEYNNTVYHGSVNIQGFSYADGVYKTFEGMRLTMQPATTDISSVATQFLTSQEVSKLKKPVTLEAITEFIDSKIDIQEPSLKETAAKEQLTEFVKEMPKRKQQRANK